MSERLELPPVRTWPFLLVVDHVVDGDTIAGDLLADAGLDVWVTYKKWRLRLWGVNAPELSTPEGQTAKAWMQASVPAKSVLDVASVSWDKYGKRIDGIVTVSAVPDAATLNDLLVEAGHGVYI